MDNWMRWVHDPIGQGFFSDVLFLCGCWMSKRPFHSGFHKISTDPFELHTLRSLWAQIQRGLTDLDGSIHSLRNGGKRRFSEICSSTSLFKPLNYAGSKSLIHFRKKHTLAVATDLTFTPDLGLSIDPSAVTLSLRGLAMKLNRLAIDIEKDEVCFWAGWNCSYQYTGPIVQFSTRQRSQSESHQNQWWH